VPLHPQGETRRIGNSDGLDRAVLRQSFHYDALARLRYRLPMERINADRLAFENLGEDAVTGQADFMPIRKDDLGVGMDFPILQSGRAMVHPARQITNFRMERTAKGDAHLLDATANPQNWDPFCNTGLCDLQRNRIPVLIVRFVAWMWFDVEMRWMNIRPPTGEQNTVNAIQ